MKVGDLREKLARLDAQAEVIVETADAQSFQRNLRFRIVDDQVACLILPADVKMEEEG